MSTWDTMSPSDYAACVDAGRGMPADPREAVDRERKAAKESGGWRPERYTPTAPALGDMPPGAYVMVRGRECEVIGPATNGRWAYRSLRSGVTLIEYPENVR